MVTVEIKRYGKSIRQLRFEFDQLWFEFQYDLVEFGKKCWDYVKEFIKHHIKRPGSTGRLMNSINFEIFALPAETGFGIGNIKKMDSEAPYWRVINWGLYKVGYKLPSGYFYPGEKKPSSVHFREGRWHIGGPYSAIVKKPIPPMYFVEALHKFARIHFRKLLDEYIKRYKK